MSEQLVTGTVAGLVAALVWAVAMMIARGARRWWHFGRLAGTYRVRPKFADPQNTLWMTAVVTASGNVLTVRIEGLPPGDHSTGQVLMSDFAPRSGSGYYHHFKGGKDLWGFRDVQVKDRNTLLVHVHWASKERGPIVTRGYIWERR